MDLFLFPVPAQDILHCPITLQHLAASTHQVDRTNNFEKKSRQPPCNRQPSVNNSSTTSHIIKLSVSFSLLSSLPPPLHWSSTECSHGSPFFPHRGSPPPPDPHTGISEESQPILNSLPTYTSPTVPTPSISPILQESADVTYTQSRDPPIPLFPQANFIAIRENKFGFSAEPNQGFGGGGSAL